MIWATVTDSVLAAVPFSEALGQPEPGAAPQAARLAFYLTVLRGFEFSVDQLVQRVLPLVLHVLQFQRPESEALVQEATRLLGTLYAARSPLAPVLWPALFGLVLSDPTPTPLLLALLKPGTGMQAFLGGLEAIRRGGPATPAGPAALLDSVRSEQFFVTRPLPTRPLAELVPDGDPLIDPTAAVQQASVGREASADIPRLLLLTTHTLHERVGAMLQAGVTTAEQSRLLSAVVALLVQHLQVTDPLVLRATMGHLEEFFGLVANRPALLAHWLSFCQQKAMAVTDYSTRRAVVAWVLSLRQLYVKSKL